MNTEKSHGEIDSLKWTDLHKRNGSTKIKVYGDGSYNTKIKEE